MKWGYQTHRWRKHQCISIDSEKDHRPSPWFPQALNLHPSLGFLWSFWLEVQCCRASPGDSPAVTWLDSPKLVGFVTFGQPLISGHVFTANVRTFAGLGPFKTWSSAPVSCDQKRSIGERTEFFQTWQVIQFLAFSSPNWRSPTTPWKGHGHVFTHHPKKVTNRITGPAIPCDLFWMVGEWKRNPIKKKLTVTTPQPLGIKVRARLGLESSRHLPIPFFSPFFKHGKKAAEPSSWTFARDLCQTPSVENVFRVEVSFKEKHTQQKKQKIHHKRHSILIPRLLKPRVFFKNIYCKTPKFYLDDSDIGSSVSGLLQIFWFLQDLNPKHHVLSTKRMGVTMAGPKDDFDKCVENPLRRCREKRDLKVLKVLLFSRGNRKNSSLLGNPRFPSFLGVVTVIIHLLRA